MLTRRGFIRGLGLGALASPLVTAVQQSGEMARAVAAPGVSAPGTWVALPNTALASVVWRDAQNRTVNDLKGAIAWYHSIKAWCGAAYRYDTDEMIIPVVGGDGDGASNEVWKVDFVNGKVLRIFDPTVALIPGLQKPGLASHYIDTGGLHGPATAVYPSARHTYNGLVHIPGTDLIWVAGGCPWGISGGSTDVFLFDTKARTWDWQSADPLPRFDLGIVAAWDPIGQRILFLDYEWLSEWKSSRPPGQRVRKLVARGSSVTVSQYWTALFDARRNRFVAAGLADSATGKSQVVFWDMAALQAKPTILVPPTSGLLPDWATAPGFDLDPENARYMLIVQGDGIYWIQAGSGSVEFEPTTGAPPPMEGWHGMFGRARFSRRLMAIVSVQDMYTGALIVSPRSRQTR